MALFVDTPDEPLEVSPKKLVFLPDLSKTSTLSIILKNSSKRRVGYRLIVLTQDNDTTRYAIDQSRVNGYLAALQATKVDITRRANTTPSNDVILVEHIITPDDSSDIKGSWESATTRNIEPWHHLLPIRHERGSPRASQASKA